MIKFFQRIHFVGIGGVGMSGLAELMLNLGFDVTGSDTHNSPIIERLNSLGARIYIGHHIDNFKNPQVLVKSSAINKNNPEIIEATRLKIPIIHRADLLAELMRYKTGIAVAGTHGKTTTTSLIAAGLSSLNLDPTVVIGGIVNSYGSTGKLGSGDLFICEADESDGTFLKLNPCVTVITNIDKDHMDHYKSLDEIINCFEKFINKVPFYGCICANMDDPILLRLLPNINQKIITYGLNPLADVTATQIELQGLKTSFVPIVNNKKLDKVTLCMPGKYNIQNALAAFAVAASLQLPLDNISTSLSRFQGVTHRFSIIGQSKSVCVVDDYAHNPHKIRTVVSHLKESMPNAHICAIVQPHRYSRVNSLLKEFGTSLKHADSAIILPVYSAGEKPIQDINHYRLANEIKLNSFYNQPSKCMTAENFEQAIDISKEIFSLEASSKEKIFLCLGAGDIKNLGPLLYKNLVEHV